VIKNVVMRDDLVLRFLHLDQLAEFGRLARLALANDLAVRLEKAGNRWEGIANSCATWRNRYVRL
jgi:hypothetical protein